MRGRRLDPFFRLVAFAPFVFVVAAGCSWHVTVSKPTPAPESGAATVYFYALPGAIAPDGPVWILEGSVLVAALEPNTYAVAHVSPGEHWLRSWTTTSPLERYERDGFDFPAARDSWVCIDKNGTMTLAADGAEFDRLRESEPGLTERTVSDALRAIAAKPFSEFPADAGEAAEREPAPITTPGEDRVLLPSGTEIPLRLVENLNSFNTRPGEPVFFAVPDDVSFGGSVAVPKDLLVEGIVQQVSRPGQGGTPGFVSVLVLKLVLPSGDVVPLRCNLGTPGRPSGAAKTLGNIGGAGINEAIGNLNPFALGFALLMFMAMGAVRGHDAWVGAGTTMAAVVRRDTLVSVSGTSGGEEPLEWGPTEPVVASSMGPIVVPDSGRVTSDWCVRLELPASPSEIRITSVADLPPPREVPTSKIVSHGTWQEARFPAWPVARFAVLGPFGPAVVPVILEGTYADGSSFFAAVEATVRTESTR